MGNTLEGGVSTNAFYSNVYGFQGVDESESGNAIMLFPNPVQNSFEIPAVSNAEVKIYDANGKLCKSIAYTEGDRIQTSDLPNGIYVLVCNSVKGIFVKKMCVKK